MAYIGDYFPEEEYVEKPREAIYFVKEGEEWRTNPIYSLDEVKNTPRRFVILKTTANGKFMKGGMLCYKYKGVELYTDEKNAIFVDTTANRLFIRDYSKVLQEIDPVHPEERQYVFLLFDNEDNEYPRWESVVGRSEAYRFVKQNIYCMDPRESVVLTDNVPLKDALSVYQFIRHIKNSGLVPEDDFEIDDYVLHDFED